MYEEETLIEDQQKIGTQGFIPLEQMDVKFMQSYVFWNILFL